MSAHRADQGPRISTEFWADLAERAVKTAAQTAAAFLVGMSALSEVDWSQLGGVVGLATLLSVLTSLSSFGFGVPGSASLTAAVQLAAPPPVIHMNKAPSQPEPQPEPEPEPPEPEPRRLPDAGKAPPRWRVEADSPDGRMLRAIREVPPEPEPPKPTQEIPRLDEIEQQGWRYPPPPNYPQ